jgi:ubiquinone/menaquinone biosynthesis C-methylase UbiE
VTDAVTSWEIFERNAQHYEQWYASLRGRRADEAESALLVRLLADFPDAKAVVEIGCGTGHFARMMTSRGLQVVGLDRAEAMLRQMQQHAPATAAILGDAHRLPFRDRAVDLAVFVTTLEFLEDPEMALAEAIRIARRGMICLVLNRWSLGGLSRRWGPQARRPILGVARDYSRMGLERMIRRAAGTRRGDAWWASTLFPDGLWKAMARIPVGDVIGMGVRFV